MVLLTYHLINPSYNNVIRSFVHSTAQIVTGKQIGQYVHPFLQNNKKIDDLIKSYQIDNIILIFIAVVINNIFSNIEIYTMVYSRKFMRSYRKSNTKSKGRRFFRSYRKNSIAPYRNSQYNSKYRRTKVRIPSRVIPDYTLVKLKLSSTIELPAGTTPAIGTYSYSFFQALGNDLFDPLLSLSVDQPNGFDQWMSFYRNFIVHKSSIKVTPIYWNTDAVLDGGPVMPFQLIIVPMSGTPLTPTPLTTDYSELPYAKARIYSGALPTSNGTTPSLTNSPGQQSLIPLTNSMMTKKILGYKDLSDVSEVRGSSTASPNRS